MSELRDQIGAALTTACPEHSHCERMGPAVWAVVQAELAKRDAETVLQRSRADRAEGELEVLRAAIAEKGGLR